ARESPLTAVKLRLSQQTMFLPLRFFEPLILQLFLNGLDHHEVVGKGWPPPPSPCRHARRFLRHTSRADVVRAVGQSTAHGGRQPVEIAPHPKVPLRRNQTLDLPPIEIRALLHGR